MRQSKHEKGDLVFLPSSVRLLQFKGQEVGLPLFINKHTVTHKPSRVLLMESCDDYYKILYDGEYWFANKKDIYGGI